MKNMAQKNRLTEHHVMFPNRLWRTQSILRTIKDDIGLKIKMPRDVHTNLHEHVPIVPPLDNFMATRAYDGYVPMYSNPVRSIENFMMSIERVVAMPSLSKIQKDIGNVAINALEAQIPFIKGTTAPKYSFEDISLGDNWQLQHSTKIDIESEIRVYQRQRQLLNKLEEDAQSRKHAIYIALNRAKF